METNTQKAFTKAVAGLLRSSSGTDPTRSDLHGAFGRTVGGKSILTATDGVVLSSVTCPSPMLDGPPAESEMWLSQTALASAAAQGRMHWAPVTHQHPRWDDLFDLQYARPGDWYGDPLRLSVLMASVARVWRSVHRRKTPAVRVLTSEDPHKPMRVVCHVDPATTIDAFLMPMRE